MAFELNLEGVWSVEGEWEEVFRGSECYEGRFYWKMIEVPVATGPYRTWRKVRVQDGNIDLCGSHFI